MSTTPPAVRSAYRDAVFPALPEEAQAAMLALQYQYDDSERWPAEEIEAQQFRQLDALLAFAGRNIPFWRDRLRRAGLRGGQKLTRALWSRLPVLTRQEMLTSSDRLRAQQLPPGQGTIVAAGGPFVTSQVAQFFQASIMLRHALWQDMAMEEKLATIAPLPPDSPLAGPVTLRQWGAPFAAFTTGPAVSLDARHPPAEQLAWLIRENPAYLLTTVANALQLARHAIEVGQRPPALRAIHAEWGQAADLARTACQQAFGLPLVTPYRVDGAGLLALPCPEHGRLHAVSENARLEILNPLNQPSAVGESGRVIVTPLHHFAMPLLRFDTGNDAEPGPPCACGRNLPVLAHLRERAPTPPA